MSTKADCPGCNSWSSGVYAALIGDEPACPFCGLSGDAMREVARARRDETTTVEHRCVTCLPLNPAQDKPRHYEREHVCEPCRLRLSSMLGELPDLCAMLPARFPRLTRPQINGSRIRSTPQASEPINITPLDLDAPADPRKRELAARIALGIDPEADYQEGDLSVATELDGWARDWLTYRTSEHLPAPLVTSLCAWLSDRLEWACQHHPAVDEFAGDLLRISRATHRASQAGRRSGEVVGRCPKRLRDDTSTQPSYCSTPLRIDPYATQIQCPRCGSTWDRDRGHQWVTLAAEMQAVGLARWQTERTAS